MVKAIHIECPYCGHPQLVELSSSEPKKCFISCYLEEGGCDSEFVVNSSWSVVVEVFRLVPGKEENQK